MTVAVILLAGWNEGPFYFDDGDPDESLNHWLDDRTIGFLGISADLAEAIAKWDDSYQAIYNSADPLSSSFPHQAARDEWLERGRVLAARLVQESPVVSSVDYQADGTIPPGTCVF